MLVLYKADMFLYGIFLFGKRYQRFRKEAKDRLTASQRDQVYTGRQRNQPAPFAGVHSSQVVVNELALGQADLLTSRPQLVPYFQGIIGQYSTTPFSSIPSLGPETKARNVK